MKYTLIFISLLLILSNACKLKKDINQSATASIEQEKTILEQQEMGVLADNAMVVTAHPEASKIGIEVLKNGGNATDAMVAIHFALTVCYPRAGNIGGGGFMVMRENNGNTHTLDFRETAPALASKDMYLDAEKNVIPRLSLDGHLAVGVPGSVDGMWKAHQKFGKLNWANLLQPAINLAENGYKLTKAEVEYMDKYKETIQVLNTEENLFTIKTPEVNSVFKQLELAKTLRLIAQNGRSGFYEGETAQLFVEEMERGNGIISLEDLKNYQSVWREALVGNYKNAYNIISMSPPSSGGVCLLQMLEMLENINLNECGFHSLSSIHLINEVERLAYADRAEHLGDPAFYNVPMENLLDTAYLDKRFESISILQATRSNIVKAGNFTDNESKETTHYSIVDTEGNAIAVTTTLNGNYGAKVVVGGAGFFLNNEMDDFSAKPGVPNQFGLIGKEANAIEAGKRMLSSMTPTIIEKNGKLFMVVGTPGGSTIITSVLQNFLNVVEYNMTMQEAVNAKRFHHQWKPDTLFVESGAFNEKLSHELKMKGHTLIEKEKIGRVDAILIHENGKLEGAADPRGEDKAMGF